MYKCILFLGLGGAGQRHLRILKEALPSTKMIGVRKTGKTPVLNSDFTVKEGASLELEYGITFFSGIDEAYIQEPDLVVIANNNKRYGDLDLDTLFASMSNDGIVYDFWNVIPARGVSSFTSIRYLSLGNLGIKGD